MAFKSTKGRTVSGKQLEVSSSDNIGLNVGVGGGIHKKVTLVMMTSSFHQ